MSSDDRGFTGYDTVLFSGTDSYAIAQHMVEAITSLWRKMTFDIEFISEGEQYSRQATLAPFRDELTESTHAVLYYFRDEMMREHWDSHGHVLDGASEGVIEIHLRQRHNCVFRISKLDEIRCPDRDTRPPLPYPAWLCMRTMLEVTLVTSSDPRVEGMSKWAFEQLQDACTEG